ncbi:chromosome segregation protein BIR1, putative [Cordyceps militaris CM01]|uniref:Chromosome segregation protein BIR1, putative n=1 Tax=Cordyceps militaris (strain CM01) TaxID=983644 RepID=G3J6U0_CORMM|nr:chromosome segregation protein BIR1, putative [Cordyceps militaris CM01]EGX96217.1 chromosome segregation protein BIR1, putative [Cordyceps militaris CM01]
MADIEKYFTYDGRLASFRKTTKKRGSTVGRGAKPLNWPHKQITPASLAKAGFYFNPSPDNPDNCTCFLCQKGLDGWEAGDDPLVEHVTHASHCGWAIVKAIEAEIEEYFKQDPTLPRMVEAREATFGTRWPHEGKKGWQCKTKQLVESGWVYTPTDESDDMATCMYCQLALDGWEPEDKPYDEHYKRSPNCAFFSLTSEPEPSPKQIGRSKATRGSKVFRASTQSVQSVFTTATETNAVDETAEPEDSILTTTSMAQGKKPRAKKATAKATKGGRKKTKKETTPVDDASDAEDESDIISRPPPPAKSTRGRKRGSVAIDDSMMSTASAPATKKRAVKTRASAAESSMASEDTAVPDAPTLSKAKGGRQSKTRKPSATISMANTSIVSLRATPEAFPDDDEIERQLEADLERQPTDEEFVYEYRRPSTQPETKPVEETIKKSAAYKMLDPEPSEPDEAEVDGELKALQHEMEVNEPEKELKVAKKGRKAAGTRKASKQTKAKKTKEPSPFPSPLPPTPPPVQSIEIEVEEQDEDSVMSPDTVVKNADSVDSMAEKRGKTKKRKSSMASEDSVDMMTYVEQNETRVKRGSVLDEEAEESPEPSPTPSPGPSAQLTSEAHDAADLNDDDLLAADDDMKIAEDPIETATSPIAPWAAEAPSTPGPMISPAVSARQAALSPSQSPQSSDAENQPPSSRPSATTKRVALAPLTATPSRMSPSKRNVIAGLQSTTPWSAANLDVVFGTPKIGTDKENGVERLLKQGKELSSPEKQMTVEEWIHFNAGEAEKKLKHECERMVSLFESEGTRAMNVLEGLAAE